jgi:hypothetical protein
VRSAVGFITIMSMVSIHENQLLPLLRGSCIYSAFARASGAKVGRDVILLPRWFHDYPTMTFGDGAIVDHSLVLGHIYSHGVLTVAPSMVGSACAMQPEALLFAGRKVSGASPVAAGSVSQHMTVSAVLWESSVRSTKPGFYSSGSVSGRFESSTTESFPPRTPGDGLSAPLRSSASARRNVGLPYSNSARGLRWSSTPASTPGRGVFRAGKLSSPPR